MALDAGFALQQKPAVGRWEPTCEFEFGGRIREKRPPLSRLPAALHSTGQGLLLPLQDHPQEGGGGGSSAAQVCPSHTGLRQTRSMWDMTLVIVLIPSYAVWACSCPLTFQPSPASQQARREPRQKQASRCTMPQSAAVHSTAQHVSRGSLTARFILPVSHRESGLSFWNALVPSPFAELLLPAAPRPAGRWQGLVSRPGSKATGQFLWAMFGEGTKKRSPFSCWKQLFGRTPPLRQHVSSPSDVQHAVPDGNLLYRHAGPDDGAPSPSWGLSVPRLAPLPSLRGI